MIKAGWRRCSAVEDPLGVFSFVAPCQPALVTKTAPLGIFKQALSANGAAHASPGQRPGYASPFVQALNGRHTVVSPLQGRMSFGPGNPGRCPGLAWRAPLGLRLLVLRFLAPFCGDTPVVLTQVACLQLVGHGNRPQEAVFPAVECGFCRQNANPTASNGRSGGKMAFRRGRISIFPGKWRFDGRGKPVLSGKWRFDACGSDVFSAERPFPPGGRAVFSAERGFRAGREAVFWPGGRFPPGRRRSFPAGGGPGRVGRRSPGRRRLPVPAIGAAT